MNKKQFEKLMSNLPEKERTRLHTELGTTPPEEMPKYGTVKDPFDSKAEVRRWAVLQEMKRRGRIRDLHHHAIVFRLGRNDKNKMIRYTPDFTYTRIDGHTPMLVAEEVKGRRHRDFPVRSCLFKKVFPEWELVVIDSKDT